ncbi:MAG: ATP-binding protein [Leptospiraceae bacterium]|nr:ATP-binding protein [Leptospiraceae bacterium]
MGTIAEQAMMSPPAEKIQEAIHKLALSGCQGNASDFQKWLLAAYRLEAPLAAVESSLDQLQQTSKVCRHSDIAGEYRSCEAPQFGSSVEYEIPSDLRYSPIQWVRSRLEAFLAYHQASRDVIVDLSIATTEAMENAVKYSTEKSLIIHYWVDQARFHIRIENEIKAIEPEDDIEAGKYDGSITLMRGMMVMVKLLDEVNIDIDEASNTAIFTATHNLRKAG